MKCSHDLTWHCWHLTWDGKKYNRCASKAPFTVVGRDEGGGMNEAARPEMDQEFESYLVSGTVYLVQPSIAN